MSADSWAEYFHLTVTKAEGPASRPSFHDLLFPRCPVCGDTCGETVAAPSP